MSYDELPNNKLKKKYSNIDNNESNNENNNLVHNIISSPKINNNINYRNSSCKLKKKKNITITDLKYAQNISPDKDQIILLENGLGVNDCFLNVIIQVLFHLEEFKSKLLQIKLKKEKNNPIFQLYSIFQKYELLSKLNTLDTLNAVLLREALHHKFGNFEKGKCGDPMETLLKILELIHNEFFHENDLNNNSNINKFCQNNLCPSHSNFLLNLKEIKYCPNCNSKNIQLYDKDCYMYDVLSYEILSLVKNEAFCDYKYSLFSKLKQLSQSFGDNKQKLESCQCQETNTKKGLFLYNKFSPYLILNITWDSDFPKMSDICKIYGLIPIFENNKNLFQFDFESEEKSQKDLETNYYLSSMILYGQNHYTCFFYNKEVDMWSFVDDDNKKNFNTYNELINYLIIRRSIPVGIIFYYINNFKDNNQEKLLLNEEKFENLYKKSLEIDQINIDENQKEETIKKIENDSSKKKNNRQNSVNIKSFINKEKNSNNNRNKSYRGNENHNKDCSISFINRENLGKEKVVIIRRSKKKV